MSRIMTPGFDTVNGRPVMVFHEFDFDGANILHFIEGNLRATVPPEGWEAYVEQYPDAKRVIPVIASQTETVDNDPSGAPLAPDASASPAG